MGLKWFIEVKESFSEKAKRGNGNPLLLGISRALAVFGKTFCTALTGMFFHGQELAKLPTRSAKRTHMHNEVRKQNSLKKNTKEIEMIVGFQEMMRQANAHLVPPHSFSAKIANTIPANTSNQHHWENKIASHANAHAVGVTIG